MAELSAAQKMRLGVFVLVGGTLLLGGIAVLLGLRLWERRDLYTVRYAESVGGLEINASVKYRGLRVGRVEGMRIAPDDPGLIEVTLSLDAGTTLYEGTVAKLDGSGLTGLKTINLVGGDGRGKILAPGTRLPSGASAVDEITDKAAVIAARLEVIATQLARFTSDENRERVERLIVGFDGFVRTADGFLERTEKPAVAAMHGVAVAGDAIARVADEGASSIAEVRGEIGKTLAAIRRPLEKLDPKEVAGTVAQARDTLAELEHRLSEAEFGRSIDTLTDTLRRINRLVQDLDLAVTASRQDFTTSLAQVREATEDLREFSRMIAQDPSVLLRGTEVKE